MKKSTKIKTIALSSAGIVAAFGLIVGGTYALFSDKVTLTNHFVGGNLDVTLKRTNLSYTYTDSEGMQKSATDSTVVDFSSPTELNVFGFGATDYMVPTDYREATLELSNSSKVAYDWYFEVTLTSQSNKFAEQLKVYVDTDAAQEGYEYSALLSQGLTIGSFESPISTVKIGATDTFKVKVEFLDLTTNNDAQNLTVDFDMVVHAQQHVASN